MKIVTQVLDGIFMLGYDGAANDYSRFLNLDEGVYGENGSVMYSGYGYAPYGPYSPAGSPVPTTGHDGQLYGAQQYQYPSPYFQPVAQTNSPSKVDFTRSAVAGQPSFTVDATALVLLRSDQWRIRIRYLVHMDHMTVVRKMCFRIQYTGLMGSTPQFRG
ncbi:hypothetical protein Hanom_Chr13g01244301 [Helianthus anomalus]